MAPAPLLNGPSCFPAHLGSSVVDWDARNYDRLSDPHVRWGAAVLERLDLAGDETVLDAGCGTGRVTEQLLSRLPRGRIVALDASPAMLGEARARFSRLPGGGRVSFVEADLLEFTPAYLEGRGRLDAVFSTATFHWVADHERLFANLRSVLRDGGQLVAQCGGEGNIAGVLAAVKRLGAERAGTWLYAPAWETAKRLERAGFGEVRCWCHPDPVSFPDRGALADFLQTVCLREHLGTLEPPERRRFAQRVAEEMREPLIDYVRLNIVARAV